MRHYQELLDRVLSLGFRQDGELKTLGLTSCTRREGVSTIVNRLATQAWASLGKRVLVVDGNLAHPRQHKTFGVDSAPGLLQAMRGEVEVEQCVHTVSDGRLAIMPAGRSKGTRNPVFVGEQLGAVFSTLYDHYDLILVDLPAISEPTNLTTVARELDGLALVLSAESITTDMAQRSLQQLSDSRILGVVINNDRA